MILARQCRAMFDLWAPEHSTLREKVLEHAFLTELSKVFLLDHGVPLEILRAEFDANGYDVAIEVGGILRHIQFKAMRLRGRSRRVDVSLALAAKPSGCVVWFVADPANLSLGPFYWLGGPPGEPLPDLGLKVARHRKANMNREKTERAAHREIPIARFQKLESMKDVAIAMFGEPAALPTTRSHAMNGAMIENGNEYEGPLGVVEPLLGLDPPRQVIRYERRGSKILATWIAPSGAFTTGEVPLFAQGDGFYDVFGQFLGDSAGI